MKRYRWWMAGLVVAALLGVACNRSDDGESNTDRASSVASTPAREPAARGALTDAAAPAPPSAAKEAGGAAGAAGSAANQQASGVPLPGTDRKVIYNVFLDLVMQDVQGGFERIGTIAEASGGLVADSNVRQEGGQRRASITIRVPAGQYQSVLGQIRDLAVKVESERSTANDVSEEFTDLQSRQRNLEATEQQLLVFLGQAKNVQEVLQVQDRLNSTRAEIEKVKGRINLLTRLTDLATIQIQLRPEAAPVAKTGGGNGASAALTRGWEASVELLGTAARGVLTAAAFSWWLLPLAAIGFWIGRRELRRRSAGRAVAPPAG